MLTDTMKALIRSFSAGSVATVNKDGTPSVSPKATFVILDDSTIAYGNIRSPRTSANLRVNPGIEVCFTDIVHRKALRVTGTGETIPVRDATPDLHASFSANWEDYKERMSSFVVIRISAVEAITSPAYDIGLTETELKEANLAKLNAL
jgi:predicted pyridoxine 5'-phosphate oxidase superfamily flavin-nucleotide-binding protein